MATTTKSGDREIVRTLKLRHPIEIGGEPVSELRFGRPRASIFRLLSQTDAGGYALEGANLIELVAQLVGLDVPIVETIDFADMADAAEICSELLNPPDKGGRRK